MVTQAQLIEGALKKPQYSGDVAAALAMAATLHRCQLRKGTSTPYLAHLLGVTALVWEYGGDEEQAIAALLHDAVEDQGGAPTLERIRLGFGDRVAGIVEACTDTDEEPKPPWMERKKRYVAHISDVREDALIVSMADKLYNVRAILADYRTLGDRSVGPVQGGEGRMCCGTIARWWWPSGSGPVVSCSTAWTPR